MTGQPATSSSRRIEYVPVDSLIAAQRNPKRHRIDVVMRAIMRHGLTAPAVVDERTGRLVVGHGRTDAVKALRDDREPAPQGVLVAADGTWLVPVVRGWASKDDAHAEAMIVADNRLTENGGWNDDDLHEMLRAIVDADPFLLATTGYGPEDLAPPDAGDGDGDGPIGDGAEDNLVVPETPTTVPGQVWRLGPHLLACGDATDHALWARLFEDTPPAQAVWTDPPYGVSYVGKTAKRLKVYNDAPDGAITLFGDALDAIEPHLADGAAVYVAHPDRQGLSLRFAQLLQQAPYRLLQQLIWLKDAHTLGRADYHYRQEPIWYAVHGAAVPFWCGDDDAETVFEYARPQANEHHPTMKPHLLVAAQLRNSARAGDVVAEPFAGTSATLVACLRLGLIFRGTELHPGYVDVGCARYQAVTGDRPVDATTGQAVDFGALAAEMAGYKDVE